MRTTATLGSRSGQVASAAAVVTPHLQNPPGGARPSVASRAVRMYHHTEVSLYLLLYKYHIPYLALVGKAGRSAPLARAASRKLSASKELLFDGRLRISINRVPRKRRSHSSLCVPIDLIDLESSADAAPTPQS